MIGNCAKLQRGHHRGGGGGGGAGFVGSFLLLPGCGSASTSLWSDITNSLKNPPAPGLSRGPWRPVLLLLCATSRAFWLLHHHRAETARWGENKSQPIKTNGPKGSWQSATLFSVTVVAFVVCPLVLQLQFPEHHAHSYCHTSACAIPSAWDALSRLV